MNRNKISIRIQKAIAIQIFSNFLIQIYKIFRFKFYFDSIFNKILIRIGNRIQNLKIFRFSTNY